MAAEATRGRFQFGALVILTLAASSAVCGLECYCGETINGATTHLPGCRSNNTCVLSDTSIGQCFVERRLQEDSNLNRVKYGCLQESPDDISLVDVLASVCNVTTSDSLSVSRCCVGENLCNKHIDIPDPSSSSSDPTGVGDKRDSSESDDSSSSMNWTVGTLITVSLFFVTLTATVVVFSALFVLLRRRATTSSIQRMV